MEEKNNIRVKFNTRESAIEEMLYQWTFEERYELQYTLNDGFIEGDTEICINYNSIEMSFYPHCAEAIEDALSVCVLTGILTKKEVDGFLKNSKDKEFLQKRYVNFLNDEENKNFIINNLFKHQ